MQRGGHYGLKNTRRVTSPRLSHILRNGPLLAFELRSNSRNSFDSVFVELFDYRLKTSLLALKVAHCMMSDLGKDLDIPALMPKELHTEYVSPFDVWTATC